MPKSRRKPSGTAITSYARDITLANKAPGGFGWGGSVGQSILDANEAILGGFYYWGPNAKNTPFRYGAMVVIPRSSTTAKPCVTQIASEELGGLNPQASIAVRKSTDNGDGSWGPWEWVNPPMELGIEYRTVERFQGKPVYVKVVDCGVMTNNKTIAITDESKRILDVILKGNPTPFPMVPNGSGLGEWDGCFTAGGLNITLYAGGELAASNHYVVAIAKLIDA